MLLHRVLATTLVLGTASLSIADTLEVPGGYPTIQSAIDAATNGDIVNVAPGTYAEQLNFLGKAIELRGAGSGSTILDGSSLADTIIHVSSVNTGTAVIRDLACINGTGTDGGGIYGYYSDLDVHDCLFSGNEAAHWGGGLNLFACTSAISGCSFENNATTLQWDGGGLASRQSTIAVSNCSFTGNTAVRHGGGLAFMASDVAIAACTFENNYAGNGGAGMYASGVTSSGSISDCNFTSNTAGNYASGVHCSGFTGSFSDCLFMNGTSSFGPGVFIKGCTSTFTNCTIQGNTNQVGYGGGVIMTYNGDGTLVDCTISGNTSAHGGGVWIYQSVATLENCDIVNNFSWEECGGLGFSGPPGFTPTISNCLIQNNTATTFGGGVYCDGSDPDISSTTICSNTPDQITGVWNDLGGNASGEDCCVGDLDGSGLVGIDDLLALIDAWGACVGCAEDLDGSGVVDVTDLLMLLDAWGPCA